MRELMPTEGMSLATTLYTYYGQRALWGHVLCNVNELIINGDSDSLLLWWRAIALGFSAMSSCTCNQSEPIQELMVLRAKPELRLATLYALLHFQNYVDIGDPNDHITDSDDVQSLKVEASNEREHASYDALMLAAKFHWLAANQALGTIVSRHYLKNAESLLKIVLRGVSVQSDERFRAQVALAWVNMSFCGKNKDKESWSQELLRQALNEGCTQSAQLDTVMALAHHYETSGNIEASISQLDRAIALQSWIPALLEKARLLACCAKWNQAVEMLHRVLQRDEKNFTAHRLLVLYELTQTGNLHCVNAYLDKMALAMECHEHHNAHLLIETSRSLSRVCGGRKSVLERVLALTMKAVAMRPTDARFLAELAHQQAMLGNYNQAINTCQEVARNDEANIEGLLEIIHCLILTGELEDAEQQVNMISVLGESIQRSPRLLLLKAKLAWQQSADAQCHVSLLQQAEKLHLRHIELQTSNDVIERCFREDAEFVILLATEYLLHVEPPISIGTELFFLSDERIALDHGCNLLSLLTDHFPGLIEAHLMHAHCCFHTHDFETALHDVEAALAIDVQSADAHLLMARILLTKCRLAEANASLEEAVACNFDVRETLEYQLTRSQLLCTEGHFEDACAQLINSLKLPGVRAPLQSESLHQPRLYECASAFVALADIFVSMNRFFDARALLAEASERFRQTSQETRILLAASELAIRCGNCEAADRMLGSVSRKSNAYVCAQVLKANMNLNWRRDKHQYVSCYREIALAFPTAESYQRLGAAYMHIQSLEAAIVAFKESEREAGRTLNLSAMIGKALIATHDYGNAAEYYTQALLAHPNDVQFRRNLAKLYAKLNKPRKAVEVSKCLDALGGVDSRC